jgi:hypothetical protein
MSERAIKWQPVPDIDSPFESISYSFQENALSVRMIGVRRLVLRFSDVVALRFEQECPGFDFLPLPLPMLRPLATFPLLLVEESPWLDKFNMIYKHCSHFALISGNHLVQLIAKTDVEARWE